jgi:hypothetical protein
VDGHYAKSTKRFATSQAAEAMPIPDGSSTRKILVLSVRTLRVPYIIHVERVVGVADVLGVDDDGVRGVRDLVVVGVSC